MSGEERLNFVKSVTPLTAFLGASLKERYETAETKVSVLYL